MTHAVARAALGLALVGGSGAAGAETRRAEVLLAADCSADGAGLRVELRARLPGRPTFELADSAVGEPGQVARIHDLAARDDAGPLPLRRAAGADLELTAARATRGEVRLSYRARAADRGRFGLRADRTGVGGVGAMFLVLPRTEARFTTRIRWRPGCGDGASSFGAGDATATGRLDDLRDAVYYAGRPRIVQVDDGDVHVRAAWFGAPALDVDAATRWAARAYAVERGVFGDRDRGTYHVFARVLPEAAERSNGIAQTRSMLLAIGPRTELGPRLRTNLAHEMLHRWLGRRIAMAGDGQASAWFHEGFAVHLGATLLHAAGLTSGDEFHGDLDTISRRHAANPRRDASNAEIARGFFADEALGVLPYTRGALYAAELDAALGHALPGFVRDLAARPLTHATFRDALRRRLGPAAVARFDAVIVRGEPARLASDAYGRCTERVDISVPRYDLGFDHAATFASDPPRIRGLRPGGPGATAGLRDGDVVRDLDALPLEPTRPVAITIERPATQPQTLRYLPAGPPQPAARWRAVPGCTR